MYLVCLAENLDDLGIEYCIFDEDELSWLTLTFWGGIYRPKLVLGALF